MELEKSSIEAHWNDEVKPLHLTEWEKANALKLARLGWTDEAIAGKLFTTADRLKDVMEGDLSVARAEANVAVLEAMSSMAKSGKHLAATMYWIKTHCRHLLPAQEVSEEGGKSTKKKEYVWNPNDPNDRVRFGVYNNDHEPNHDY